MTQDQSCRKPTFSPPVASTLAVAATLVAIAPATAAIVFDGQRGLITASAGFEPPASIGDVYSTPSRGSYSGDVNVLYVNPIPDLTLQPVSTASASQSALYLTDGVSLSFEAEASSLEGSPLPQGDQESPATATQFLELSFSVDETTAFVFTPFTLSQGSFEGLGTAVEPFDGPSIDLRPAGPLPGTINYDSQSAANAASILGRPIPLDVLNEPFDTIALTGTFERGTYEIAFDFNGTVVEGSYAFAIASLLVVPEPTISLSATALAALALRRGRPTS